MNAYRELAAAGVTTRAAAALTGVARSTATRAPSTRRPTRTPTAPVNQLTAAEQDRVLAILNSAEFIDRTPLQVYATLLRQGTYLCSVSTMYRILAANMLVKDRRRQARHPARARPELIATGPGQVFTWLGGREHLSSRLPQIPA